MTRKQYVSWLHVELKIISNPNNPGFLLCHKAFQLVNYSLVSGLV